MGPGAEKFESHLVGLEWAKVPWGASWLRWGSTCGLPSPATTPRRSGAAAANMALVHVLKRPLRPRHKHPCVGTQGKRQPAQALPLSLPPQQLSKSRCWEGGSCPPPSPPQHTQRSPCLPKLSSFHQSEEEDERKHGEERSVCGGEEINACLSRLLNLPLNCCERMMRNCLPDPKPKFTAELHYRVLWEAWGERRLSSARAPVSRGLPAGDAAMRHVPETGSCWERPRSPPPTWKGDLAKTGAKKALQIRYTGLMHPRGKASATSAESAFCSRTCALPLLLLLLLFQGFRDLIDKGVVLEASVFGLLPAQVAVQMASLQVLTLAALSTCLGNCMVSSQTFGPFTPVLFYAEGQKLSRVSGRERCSLPHPLPKGF